MVKVIYLITLLDALGMAFTFPLLNANVLALGGSLSLSGILQSCTAGAQLFASPVIGSWSDARGRKLLLLITLCTVFISNVFSGIPSLLSFFFGQILYGISHQTDPLTKALITDSVPHERLPDIFNKLMAIAISAFVVGPVLGGILYEMFKSFSYISILLCSLDITTITITYLFVEEPLKPKPKDVNNKQEEVTRTPTFLQSIYADLGKVFSNLKNVEWSRYGDLLAIKFILEAEFNMLFMNMGVIVMEKFLFTQTQVGLALSYLSITMIAATFLSGFVIKKFYEADQSGFQRIVHGFVTLVTLFCVLPFTDTSISYFSVFSLACILKAFLDSTWMEALSNRTTETDKGVMMGAAASMLSLAGLVCPIINGFTGDFIGVGALTALPLIPAVAGMVLISRVKDRVSITAEKQD